METIKVFYSWQSDIDSAIGQNAIRSCINSSFAKIQENNTEHKLYLDEATRDCTGSPDIVEKIFQKIQECDIYIADITTISESSQKRKTPNPNVLIELGFAIKSIGWDRILLLFNKNSACFPDDLPFDIDKNRCIKYSIQDGKDKSGFGTLSNILNKAISDIIEKNPKKGFHVQKTSADIKRQRDIDTINVYLESLNIPLIDSYIADMPFKFDNRILYFVEDLKEKMDSNYFFLYDLKVKDLFSNFMRSWDKSLSYSQYYEYDDKADIHRFSNTANTSSVCEVENKINESINDMKHSFQELLEEIRTNWLEIDVNQKSDYALKAYYEWKKNVTRIFSIEK